MGACCTGKENKYVNKDEEIYTKNSRSAALTEYKINAVPKMELEVEKSNLSQRLTEIVLKYGNNVEVNLTLKKIGIEKIWNVTKFYQDDFTNSKYLLLDLRDKTKKTENFLKKYRTINYSLEEMKLLNDNLVGKFKKFVDFKHIIFILAEEQIQMATDIIDFFIEKKIHCKILLFDSNLNSIDLSPAVKNLTTTLDVKQFNFLPYILLPLKFFPHLKSENFIFLNYTNINTKSNNKFTQIFLQDQKNSETEIIKFAKFFKLASIANINKLENNENFYINHDTNINKTNDFKLGSNNTFLTKIINFPCINTINDLKNKKEAINSFLDILKFDIISNKSILLNIEEGMENEVLVNLLMVVIWKLTDVSVGKIKNYISENFIFVKGVKDYLTNFGIGR